MTKGVEKVGRKNKGDYLESAIKEDKGKEGDALEKVGKDNLFETVEQKDLDTVGKEDSAPPAPPRRSQRKVEQEDFEQLGRRIRPQPPHPKEVNKKAVLLHVMSELGLKSGIKRTMSLLGGRIMDIGSR